MWFFNVSLLHSGLFQGTWNNKWNLNSRKIKFPVPNLFLSVNVLGKLEYVVESHVQWLQCGIIFSRTRLIKLRFYYNTLLFLFSKLLTKYFFHFWNFKKCMFKINVPFTAWFYSKLCSQIAANIFSTKAAGLDFLNSKMH